MIAELHPPLHPDRASAERRFQDMLLQTVLGDLSEAQQGDAALTDDLLWPLRQAEAVQAGYGLPGAMATPEYAFRVACAEYARAIVHVLVTRPHLSVETALDRLAQALGIGGVVRGPTGALAVVPRYAAPEAYVRFFRAVVALTAERFAAAQPGNP
jgi:hypothetical protein